MASALKTEHSRLTGVVATTDHPGFQLEWTPWTPSAITDAVVFGSIIHDNAGGWVEQVYIDNFVRIIEEKTTKAQENAVQSYEPWWLVLVDYVFPGTQFGSRFDVAGIDKGAFERIIVIDQNAGRVLEW